MIGPSRPCAYARAYLCRRVIEAANLNASALIGQVGLVKHALLFFRSYNLNFHARLFGKQ